MFEQIKSWLDLAQIGQSRSSITNPLQWTMVILVAATLACAIAHMPAWVTIFFLACFGLVFSLFLYAYLHFMHTKPDVLRSEQFHLQKMVIERGYVGDSIHGLTEATEVLNKGDMKLLDGAKGTSQP
jgi:hypothetical protein